MFLLDETKSPDHSAIARFKSLHISLVAKTMMAKFTTYLYKLGEISGDAIFIDGTKIEANANRISEEGTELRMNRSIQAEGSFAQTKEDMGFRRYLSRGKENVLTERILLALGHNINKLHNKIQGNRCDSHFF